jgi:hypothetical protein
MADLRARGDGTRPALPVGIMSISERMTRGLSLWLVTALAATTIGWTGARRAGNGCSPQDHDCAPMATLACCCHSVPGPSDAARLPDVAPSPGTPSHASLMEFAPPPAPLTPCARQRSRHALRRLDLGILHRTFLL